MDKLGNCRDCAGTCKLNHHAACDLQAVSAGNQRNTGCGENRNRKTERNGTVQKIRAFHGYRVSFGARAVDFWRQLQHRRNHNRIDRFGRSLIITSSDLDDIKKEQGAWIRSLGLRRLSCSPTS